MEETLNEHHCHRVLSCSKLKQTIKNSIEQNLFLRYNENMFKTICNNVSSKIKKELEKYNKTLEQIDELIKIISEFRECAIRTKEDIKNLEQTFDIIKSYYTNYYEDLKKIRENKNEFHDIHFLHYINNIYYEFEDIKIESDDNISQKILDLSNYLENMKKNNSKIIDVKYKFFEINRNYHFENFINKVHENYITSLIELSNNRILTSCRKDFQMKIFKEENEGTYKEVQTIKGKCGCCLYLKESKKNFSGDSDGVIYVYEENKTKEFRKICTLASHSNSVNVIAKISENQIISGDLSDLIVIWKYIDINWEDIFRIKIGKLITNIICLSEPKIVFTCDDGIIYIYI